LNNPRSSFSSHRYLRLFLVVVAIAGCLLVIKTAAAYGISQLLATYALTSGNVVAAEKAIRLSPNDAGAHFSAAAVFGLSGAPDQAIPEFENAVALRPADYRLWAELGLLRDQTGDVEGALAAFDEAVRRAPFYSLPRWNRGNVLLRKGEYEAAFNDLNQAAQSNPELKPSLIDLAWGVSRGDVKLTEQLAQINGDQMRIVFARLLARQGKVKDAVAQYASAGNVPEAVKRELVEQFVAKGAFREAFDIWKVSHSVEVGREGPAIYDGGFEGSLSFDQGGFNWRVPRALQATSISLDSRQPHSGAKDLKVEFSGNSNPAVVLVSQLILVEPSKHYKINFSARSQDVVTGGLPFLSVSDASGDQKSLGQSPPLASGTTEWRVFSFEFTTTPTTSAVLLRLQRQNCTESPCPIFGSLSLDSFSIEQLK
jgi:hypothetical protein